MDGKSFLEILHTAERLKDTLRHCTTANRRPESVAEHSWRIALMAMLSAQEFPDADMNKVMQMCLIHDMGECFTGDIPTFQKTDADRQTEESLLQQWLSSLPHDLSERLTSLFAEMEQQETQEAKIFKAFDKLEALVQHNESPLDTWSENEFTLNQTYAFDTAAFSEWLTALRNDILAETLRKIERETT